MYRRRFIQTSGLAAAATALGLPSIAQAPGDWLKDLGHGFGLALHDYSEATLDVAANAGFTLIRTDFFWSGVETKRHVYD
jgi:hypothetical protein